MHGARPVATPDALVVGGGLAGLSAALHLARRGARVLVVEREVVGRHASSLNAGGVRRVNRDPRELPMAEAALARWPRLSDELGYDVGFRAVGHLLVAEDEAELDRVRARAASSNALGFAHERLLDAAEARDLCPGIAPHVRGGLYAADDGHADPAATVAAFRRAAEASGATIWECVALLGLERDGEGWAADTTAGRVAARAVLNCAGAWGGRVAALAGEGWLPCEPQAPMALATPPLPPFLGPVVQTLTRRLTLKQDGSGRALVGGGHRARLGAEEAEAGRPALVPGEAEANLATARSLFPAALGGVPVARAWAGVDGYTPDRVPVLGRATEGGVVHAWGFSGHGFALAPALGEALAALALGETPAVDVSGLSPARFSLAPPTPPTREASSAATHTAQ